MRIDKTWQYDSVLTIDFQDFLSILLEPRIAQSIFRLPDGNNFAPDAENCPIFDDAEFFQLWAASRTEPSGWGTQSKKLAHVGQKQGPLDPTAFRRGDQ